MADVEILGFGMTNSVSYQFKKILGAPESNSWHHSLEQPLAKEEINSYYNSYYNNSCAQISHYFWQSLLVGY